MMRRSEFPVSLLYLSAFLVALFARMLLLDKAPLSDYEATWALQALDVARGSQPLVGAHAVYVSLTSVLFFIFPSSEFWARLVPALFGSLIVLAPFFMRCWLNERPAIILAFALALDPGLLAASRQVGAPGLAMVCLLMMLVMLGKRVWGWAAFFAALAWMSGPQVWSGLIILGLSLVIVKVVAGRRGYNLPQEAGDLEMPSSPVPLRQMVLVGLGTVLVIGSVFAFYPRALSASFSGIITFLAGWAAPSGVPTLRILAALLVYAPIPVILGLTGVIRSWSRDMLMDHFMSVWAGIALLVILIYPGRQVNDMVWVSVPLWGLAARQLDRMARIRIRENRFPTYALALFTSVVWGYIWLNLANQLHPQRNVINLGALLNNPNLNQSSIPLSLIMVYIALVLITAVCLLIAWGWSAEIGVKGFAWGTIAFLITFTLAAASSAAGYKPSPGAELLDRDTAPAQADFLIGSLDQLSELNLGRPQALEIVTVVVDSDALRWLLRSQESVSFTTQLPTGQQPEVVVTWDSEQPQLASTYRGQDFIWKKTPDWGAMLPSGYLSWMAFRQAPWQQTSLILWVRSDLFMDTQLAPIEPVP